MVCEAVLLRSPAISANRAKSVSWSAKRADLRDSNKRTSSSFFWTSNGSWNNNEKNSWLVKIVALNQLLQRNEKVKHNDAVRDDCRLCD